jgi:hypothetical protein
MIVTYSDYFNGKTQPIRETSQNAPQTDWMKGAGCWGICVALRALSTPLFLAINMTRPAQVVLIHSIDF